MLIEHILEGIAKEEEGRERASPIRMSSAGKCQRAIAYQNLKYPCEPIPPRGLMVFRLGHIVEAEVKALIGKYCPKDYVIEYPQEDVRVDVGSGVIVGHVDGVIKHPIEAVLEVKSINAAAFKRLDTEGISYDYQCQATMYMKGLNLSQTLFIFYNKDTSHLKEMVYEYDDRIYSAVHQRWNNVLLYGDQLPDREFGPDTKGKLPWNCSYCSYSKECWPEAETVFDKRNKPSLIVRG